MITWMQETVNQRIRMEKDRMEELKRFETDLKNSDELKQKLEAALKRLAEEDRAQSDGELMVIAARELGYDISIAALEKAEAEAQELDLNELEKAAGGVQEWCLGNYACIDLYNSPESDEYDHNGMCITVWHCLTAFLHTDHGDSNNVLCWSNYQCVKWNN